VDILDVLLDHVSPLDLVRKEGASRPSYGRCDSGKSRGNRPGGKKNHDRSKCTLFLGKRCQWAACSLLSARKREALKAETKRPCDRVRVVVIAGNLSIITNGGPDSGSDLDANVRVNEKRVMSKVRPAKKSAVAPPNAGADAVRGRFKYLNSCSQASLSPGTTEMFSTCHV